MTALHLPDAVRFMVAEAEKSEAAVKAGAEMRVAEAELRVAEANLRIMGE